MSAEFSEGIDLTAVKRSLRQQAWREIKQFRQEAREGKQDFINSKIFLSEYINILERTQKAIWAVQDLIYSYWPKH